MCVGCFTIGWHLQLKVVRAERDNLREDLKGHKDSKRLVDNSWREERKRAERLEKELQFYQGQSARAMKDRDQVFDRQIVSYLPPPSQLFLFKQDIKS